MDSDPQGNATSGLGVDKRAVQTSIYDVMINGVPASQAVRKTDIQNLFLLPSNIDLAGAEIEMVSMLSRETILSRAILEIQQDYDFMLLDAPPSLGCSRSMPWPRQTRCSSRFSANFTRWKDFPN